MAKKKLFGNRKEPRCETCAHGKLSANGESVLCVQGGALPLSHSCRRYQYDPLRRVPKRRPVLGEYSAADFALDEQLADANATVPQDDSTAASSSASDSAALDRLLDYLDSHDTPDADTILAILTDRDPADKVSPDPAPTSVQDRPVVLFPDDSPDIAGDLARLDSAAAPALALTPLADAKDEPDPLFLADSAPEVLFLTEDSQSEEAPLSADDLLFLSDDEF